MPEVIGIRFKSCGKVYDFEVDGIDVKEGDYVIVESDFGLSLARVVMGRHTIEKGERELKRIVRAATEEDFRTKDENKKLEGEARDFCLERIMARGLPMKLVSTEATLDKKRIVFYFTAEGRIDFRELVKDLAARFKTRIEMRQIGVRDEAKLIGGLGVCGRPLCCNSFLSSFEPVSIKMAKKQEMVLNIGKLSGLCSRLMCCLRYEYDGDLAAISADDEIPRGVEDAPIEVLEKKISHHGKDKDRQHCWHKERGCQKHKEHKIETPSEPKEAALQGLCPQIYTETPAEAKPEAKIEAQSEPKPETKTDTQPEAQKENHEKRDRRRFRRRRPKK